MIGDGAAGIPPRQAFNAHDVHKETDQFERPGGQRIGPRAQVGIVIEQMRQVVLQHAAT